MEMFRFLLDNYDFKKVADNIYRYNGFLLEKIPGRHLYFDSAQSACLNGEDRIDGVVFLSKHSSEAKIKSLTVHPTGNFGDAALGGKERNLSVSYPPLMTQVLRRLWEFHSEQEINITFEATHHGPLLLTPNFFLEIGTTPMEWENREILEMVCSSLITAKPGKGRNFIGIGGGHYMPKITDYVLGSDINIGHMISKHAAAFLDEELFTQALEKTPQCSGVVADWKGIKSATREIVKAVTDKTGIELIKI
ncbi:D-tyrosyl-tRNA(Tyr) deacylase [Thermoplasmatales archaeon AK]|nr:D-tyrosyl-tRNA(Tyr) deacylase [Thermoplasmatales archaeon AK]